MKIAKLKLTNFRNYKKLELDFSKSKNIIIGNNGSGKTNIIEAIYYLSLTKSFRAPDEILIKENTPFAIIESKIKEENTNNYKIVLTQNSKNIKINNKQINRLSDYISKINVILFSVEDMKLIKDNPSAHRKLITMDLSSIDNEYLILLSTYNRVLKQRNTYLKQMMINSTLPKNYLNIITEKLVDLNLKIYKKRKEYIKSINSFISEIFYQITNRENLTIDYITNIKYFAKEELLKDFDKNLMKDINYGKTTIGIHLDDYVFKINNQNIKAYLSEGETKNAVISYKLSEIKYCQSVLKKSPILLLDDLFSELDKNKINNILQFLDKDIQTFITTTDIHKVSKKILTNCNVYKIKNGKIKVVEYE